MARELNRDDVAGVFERARVIAVLGAHSELARPACYVPAYLSARGYRVIPVNPRLEVDELWGEPVRATLADIGEPVDVVDVFRPSARIADHVDGILAMAPRPRVVWLQLGIRDAAAAARLVGAGIDVVQDRCMLADHRRLAGA